MKCEICNDKESTKKVQDVNICPDCFFKATRCGYVPDLKKLVGKPKAIEPEPQLPPVTRHHSPPRKGKK
jgi:hypothetical protein